MSKSFIIIMSLALITSLVNAKEDLGKTTYLQVCSACHGANGEGMKIEGAVGFPPLAGSEWLRGDADRVAQILIHGLQGPITVKGEQYNQVMPQQGALTDEMAVAVINYVRTEFADEKGGYNLDDFKKTKKSTADKNGHWNGRALLRLYPLPKPKSPIKNLIMRSYSGEWDKMPDFPSIEEEATEEEHDGYISLKKINKKNSFGLVWDGEFEVMKAGLHTFELDSDDGSRLSINGKVVAQVKGRGPMNRQNVGKIKLLEGTHTFRLEYFQSIGGQGITLRYKQPKRDWQWLSDVTRKAKPKKKVVIDLTPKDGKVRMYRNFINGSSPRTMGVGYPLGNNIAFSTSDCNLDLVWKGNFISAGRHWTGRGQGSEDPASSQVVKISRGVAWSDPATAEPFNVQLKGIQTDEIGSPTFGYMVNDSIKVNDSFLSSANSLERTLSIDSSKQQKVHFKIADTGDLQGNELIIENLKISIPASAKLTTKGKSQFAIIDLNKGNNSLNINYSWTK